MEPSTHIDMTLDMNDYEAGVYDILTQIRPSWSRGNIEIKLLVGGLVNKTLRIIYNGDLSDGLILRINGPGELVGMSRTRELECIKLLNNNDIGVPLVASFNNGIVSKLVQGKSLDDEVLVNKMVDEKFVRKFTAMLAKMHHLSAKDTTPLTKENNVMMTMATTSLKKARQIRNHSELDKFTKEVVSWDQMEKEIDFLYSEAEKLNMPTGLSHNDLWHTNMLYDEKTDAITIIDFETMGVNFQPFDVATYLVFLLRSHIIPVSLPTPKSIPEDFPQFFVRCYLEEQAQLQGKPASSVTKEQIRQFLSWTKLCTKMYLLLWTPIMIYWIYYQQQRGMDMNCVEIAYLWYNEYKKLKEENNF